MKLAIAIALTSIVAVAGAQGKHPMKGGAGMSKAEWQKSYDMAAKTFDSMKVDNIFAYTTPDFTMTMMGQTENKSQCRTHMNQMFGMMKNFDAKFTVTNVAGDANKAHVTCKFMFSGTTKPDPKSHKPGKMTNSGIENSDWVKVKGKWMMKNVVMTDVKVTMNGKPMPMGTAN